MRIKPQFFYCNEDFKNIWNKHGVYFSTRFCCFFVKKVEEIFLKECNLKASYKVGLSLFKQDNAKPMYEYGIISKLNIGISILPEYIDDLEFCWKSKDGKIIKTTDEDFEEGNLICWIEGLKPKEYWEKAFGKKTTHPFEIKNLPFEFEVIEFGTHMAINIELSDTINSKDILVSLENLIENFNEKSLLKERENGIIHNSSYEVIGNIINYRIDLGSAGVNFLKKILKQLSKFNNVNKVVFDL